MVSSIEYLTETIKSPKPLNPLKVISYGSAARGETHEWSDYNHQLE